MLMGGRLLHFINNSSICKDIICAVSVNSVMMLLVCFTVFLYLRIVLYSSWISFLWCCSCFML
jgi:hypothetical protein